MYQTTTWNEKMGLLLRLLIPILITQISLYLMNFFDTIMSGQKSAQDLAGVAIGSSLWVPIFTGIDGILLAISPIVAQLIGAKKGHNIAGKVQQGIYLAITLALTVVLIGTFILTPILQAMDLEGSVRHVAKYYLIFLAAGIIPLFVFNTIRCFIDATGQTRVSMFIILTSLPINVIFNYIFIFGKFGFPALGGIGAGLATAITYWIICLIALVITAKQQSFRHFQLFTNWSPPSITQWWEQLRIGVPIGFAIFFETSIFAAVTLFMSVYSTYTIAAHEAAMNFASLLYMLPLSVGMALTIAVGFEVGANRFHDAKMYGRIGMGGGIFIALFCGLSLYIFKDTVAAMYNTNPDVINLTKHFILYAIFYQLADAFGAPVQGMLRGYKDVTWTLVITFISYWIIGLPSGYILANYTTLEPFGYWVGIIIGLSFGAITLLSRLLYVQKKYSKLNALD